MKPNKKRRLIFGVSVLISVIWFLGVLAAASNAYNPFEDLFGGNLPLIVLWGIYFIYKYVKKAED